MPSFPRPLLGLFFALALVTAGCDAGSTGNTADLIVDAQIARQNGDLNEAIDLYTEALRSEPDNAVVRTELAGVHLERADVDLLDLTAFVEFLSDAAAGTEATATPATAGRGGSTCSYANDPTAVAFDPSDVVDFDEILGARDVIQLAMAILSGGGPVPGGSAVLPAQITGFTVCTGIVGGEIVMDRAAAVASMSALGLTNQQIASALAVDALARFIDAYFFVTVDLPQETTWYRLADGSIGVCATDQDQLREDAEVAVQGIGRALAGLDLRAHVLNAGPTDPVRQIVDDAVDAYATIENDLAPYCEGT